MSALARTSRVQRVTVLAHDTDLGAALAPSRLVAARPASVAQVLRRSRGPWDARTDAHRVRGGYGLLVLDGLLVRRVGLAPRFGVELLGAGDILQPDQHDGEAATVPFSATWRVLAPIRLGVLDAAWAARMAAFPEVGVALVGRALVRSRRLASVLAIVQHHRLEDRIELLLWELADRFGRVRPDGVLVDVGLTHELISQLVGARRPSVSMALTRLAREDRLRRAGAGWLLTGSPDDSHLIQSPG